MTWRHKELSLAGRFAPQGMCPSCGADLVPRMRLGQKHCFYFCSRAQCCFADSPVPPSSGPYTGPKKRA